ncbi:MAG: hypothetical protein Terrestrivirus5_92 [Terrestrivirus sp.]|uniref:Microbial-type PARG catalytic domain-containing protein n=1 Tax=Terrestrivirus sp. TaxID=2487775 RepID=A0A3G4ZN25_9VIRU|nr:MAG: hypothetical protein Terrestrivirus5_92 [Terrestrivirus sp.]
MSKIYLINIYKDTKSKCLNGMYAKCQTSVSIKRSTDELKAVKLTPKFDKTIVEIFNMDTLVACHKALREDPVGKICALNMASLFGPGGGAERGAMAQEEELFRRTNYFLTLKDHFYKLINGDVIFSPDVTIIKDVDYNDLEDPFTVSFIASAAPKHPGTKYDKTKNSYKYISYNDREHITNSIDNIFRMAYLQDKDTLVLGALGCGAYANPVNEVVDIFNKCLKQYDGAFKRIIFAVYSRRDDNYDIFNSLIVRL